MNAKSLWGGIVGLGVLAYLYDAGLERFNKDVERRADEFSKSIEQKVALDAMNQLLIVMRNGGSPTEACVYAGSVSAALVQSKDETDYQWAKQMEDTLCRRAGLR
jgi:hypothetical protein